MIFQRIGHKTLVSPLAIELEPTNVLLSTRKKGPRVWKSKMLYTKATFTYKEERNLTSEEIGIDYRTAFKFLNHIDRFEFCREDTTYRGSLYHTVNKGFLLKNVSLFCKL